MMQAVYTILQVAEDTKLNKNGKAYKVVTIDYKEDGQAKTYKAFEFNNKELYAQLKGLKQGQTVTVSKVKENDYWNWTAISLGGTVSTDVEKPATDSVPASKFVNVSKDHIQDLIVRQSSLGHAVATLAANKATAGGFEASDVISVAAQYEEFVHNGVKKAVKTDFSDMADSDLEDIPG
jgi:uncharacterized protein YlxP (DUF503 family)